MIFEGYILTLHSHCGYSVCQPGGWCPDHPHKLGSQSDKLDNERHITNKIKCCLKGGGETEARRAQHGREWKGLM